MASDLRASSQGSPASALEAPARGSFSDSARQALRERELGKLGPGYRPWLHLLGPSSVALALALYAFATLEDVQGLEWLVIPATYLLANAAEWRIHRDLLHRRSRLFPWLYERHTLMHHHVFVQWDLSVRSRAEWGLVLIPPMAVVLLCVATLPLGAAIAALGAPDAARLFLITSVAYVISYEWLHLSYHLPEDSRVGSSRLVRWLRRHHAIHHHPSHMGTTNFNVTVPLWDTLRRTTRRAKSEPAHPQATGASTSS